MSDDLVDVVPDPVISAPNPAWEAEVERRGEKLCLAAEPHGATVAPCVVHSSEARRGLFEAWLDAQRVDVMALMPGDADKWEIEPA